MLPGFAIVETLPNPTKRIGRIPATRGSSEGEEPSFSSRIEKNFLDDHGIGAIFHGRHADALRHPVASPIDALEWPHARSHPHVVRSRRIECDGAHFIRGKTKTRFPRVATIERNGSPKHVAT